MRHRQQQQYQHRHQSNVVQRTIRMIHNIRSCIIISILCWITHHHHHYHHNRKSSTTITTSTTFGIVVNGFAYAPNFITKYIEEQTLILPNPNIILPSSSLSSVVSTSPAFVDKARILNSNSNNNNDNNNNKVHSTNDNVDPMETTTTVSSNVAASTVLDPSPSLLTTASSSSSSTIVRTRFPPEPNGYLHLGHAKSIAFNYAVARSFYHNNNNNQQPQHTTTISYPFNMRLDDTNPSKEEAEYVTSILQDVQWILSGLYNTNNNNNITDEQSMIYPWDGPVRKTSDYFDFIYECAMALIRSGDAYVDSLSIDEMKEYRGTLLQPGLNSPYRNRTIDENIQLLTEMKQGIYPDGKHIVRAKIDMSSSNMNLRDPTLYRIKHEIHQETGDTWCIYPMYDFSHPISDAIENITHSLCTLEFEDHRPFYDWTIDKLCYLGLLDGQQKPQQIEFSRLNIKSTVLSKRKLIQLVQENHVNGWDDPRLPTIAGLRRRGIPPAAIRLFCERIGISKSDSFIDYTVFEDCIREVMDTSSPRAFAILDPLLVTITNYNNDDDSNNDNLFHVDRHPKNKDMGQRTISFTKQIYIERSDFFDIDGPEGIATGHIIPPGFKRLLPPNDVGGDNRVRLRYAYVIECHTVIRDPITNEPIELLCTYNKETRAGVTPTGMNKVNGIIHWVDTATSIPCTVNIYDRLFSTEEPGSGNIDGDFLQDINPNSLLINTNAYIERSVYDDIVQLKQSKIPLSSSSLSPSLNYQFERNGYFALDVSSTIPTTSETINGSDLNKSNNIVFNRVVTLRDTWGIPNTATGATSSSQQQQPKQRTRGNTAVSSDGVSQDNNSNESTINGIRRVAIRVATIISVEAHPDAESLLVCQVDCGDTNDDGTNDENKGDTPVTRTVVAGLAGKIPIEELIGRKVVAITNLKPAKMRGIESTAMLLATSNGLEGTNEIVELLTVPNDVANGELISFEDMEPSQPDTMLKSKGAIKVYEKAKANLRINDNGDATYVDEETGTVHRMVTSYGPIRAATLTNTIIQ